MKLTVSVPVAVALSPSVTEMSVTEITGGSSSSVIVTVATLSAPDALPLSAPESMVTLVPLLSVRVSASDVPSSVMSPVTDTSAVPVSDPAAMLIDPAVMAV